MSGTLFGLLVLAAHLPNTLIVVHDSQGHSTGQTQYEPFLVGWTLTYVGIAAGCVIFGGRVAQVVGFILLALGLFS